MLSVFLAQKARPEEHSFLRRYIFALTDRKCHFHLQNAGSELEKLLLSKLPSHPTSQAIRTPQVFSLLIKVASSEGLCSHFTLVASSSTRFSLSPAVHTEQAEGWGIMFPIYISALLNSIYILIGVQAISPLLGLSMLQISFATVEFELYFFAKGIGISLSTTGLGTAHHCQDMREHAAWLWGEGRVGKCLRVHLT